MTNTKICSKCGLTKPINDFYKAKSTRDGHFSWCKECDRMVYKSRMAKTYKKNADHAKAMLRRVIEFHRPDPKQEYCDCKACGGGGIKGCISGWSHCLLCMGSGRKRR